MVVVDKSRLRAGDSDLSNGRKKSRLVDIPERSFFIVK